MFGGYISSNVFAQAGFPGQWGGSVTEFPEIKCRRWHTCGYFSEQSLKGQPCGWTRALRVGIGVWFWGPGWALTEVIGEPPAILSRHDPLIFQVTLVPHQDHLSVVPGVGLDLRGPVEFEGHEARNGRVRGIG